MTNGMRNLDIQNESIMYNCIFSIFQKLNTFVAVFLTKTAFLVRFLDIVFREQQRQSVIIRKFLF